MVPVARPWGTASVPSEPQGTTSCGLAEPGCVQEFCNWLSGPGFGLSKSKRVRILCGETNAMNSIRLSTPRGASCGVHVHKHVPSNCRDPHQRHSKRTSAPDRDSAMLLHRNALRSPPHQAVKDLSSPLCHLRGEGGGGGEASHRAPAGETEPRPKP